MKKQKIETITEKRLEKKGFVRKHEPHEIPATTFKKSDIVIWHFNDSHWIVDALDQGGIEVEFCTMQELSDFFKSCKREF